MPNTSMFKTMRYAVASVWLITAAVVLWIYPLSESIKLVNRVGLFGPTALFAVYAGVILDLIMGLFCVFRPSKNLWLFQLVITLGYSICIAFYLPEFLIHPFGPVLKNIPFMAIIWLLYHQPNQAK